MSTNTHEEEIFAPFIREEDGVDYSLLTGLELPRFHQYAKLRTELAKQYPKPEHLREDPEDILNIDKAKYDIKAPVFLRLLTFMEAAFQRVDLLQAFATEYEKKTIRIYGHLSLNWIDCGNDYMRILGDEGLYETVENYFKILRKYGLHTDEEPYYFLTPQQKRKIRYVGDMLKRSTQLDDSEIKLSFLDDYL